MSQGRRTVCRKGCCWVPFEGVCGKQGNCQCHTGYREAEEDRAAIISMEQARLERVRQRRKEATWTRG